jgi:hypothetical protein
VLTNPIEAAGREPSPSTCSVEKISTRPHDMCWKGRERMLQTLTR